MATNLGTAWIQIKPSMAGMTSAIRSELSGAGEDEGGKFGTKFTTGFAAKMGVMGSLASKAVSAAWTTINNQINDAVNRADTLNRFPKVMEMMGYSADEAAEAIEKLRDGVKGIPTSLADVVSGAQRLAAITGDVNTASDWVLALSDAMLITTGDVSEAARGMEQFMQMLSRGKPAGNDWNTIMEVASPIMNELARSLGYAGAELGGDFYTALQDGTQSMEGMMDALVNLDKNGGEGLESLHKRVETATGGIGASMTSLKQSISNAIVSIIQEIGSANIEAVINGIRDVLVGFVGVVKNIVTFVKENWDWIMPIGAAILTFFAGGQLLKGIVSITEKVQKMGGMIGKLFGKQTLSPIAEGAKSAGEGIASFFKSFADPAILLGAVEFAAVAASIAAAIVLIGGAIGVVTPAIAAFFSEVLLPVGDWIVNTLLVVLEQVAGMIADLTTNAIIPLIDTLSGAFTSVLKTVGDVITNVLGAALEGIARILEATGDGFLKMGRAIEMALNGAQGVLQVFADLISSIAEAAVAIVAMVTGHSINYGNGYAHLFAKGGRVEGPGTATSDSIPAFLSDGEYVVRAAAAREIGYDNLERMNDTGKIGGGQNNYFTINGYNKSPEELASIISRKIAFNTRGVMG